jgi:hypothetical protein
LIDNWWMLIIKIKNKTNVIYKINKKLKEINI